MNYLSHSAKDTLLAGKDFAESRLIPAFAGAGSESKSLAVLLSGDLGAGKTQFVKGIAVALGITTPVASPTFAIVNEYTGRAAGGRVNLLHFDLYRLNSMDDLDGIGFYDYLAEGGVFAVEWQERAIGMEREFDEVYRVNIIKTGEETREISIEYIGD
jgi:tRNA threonylcarbamoyladenosine biosynthesis protein TsaE